ncbi:MAG: hypothetical protein KDA84_03585, partial [Planctomycetaceae bacterium]|nr:hypothetical protein [Planctomycetaceae bacterium]
DGEWDQGGLLQGQGFANVGNQTYIYYGAWDPRVTDKSTPRGGVGIAVLPRDRFGSLSVDETRKGPGTYQVPELIAELMTGKIKRPSEETAQFFLNAEGLGPEAHLRVELLSRNMVPLPEYCGENAAVVKSSGFQVPVQWKGNPSANSIPEEFRIRARFEGERKADIRLNAIYVR